LGGCLRTVEADAFHPLILRLYLNFSFANFVTACAIGTLQRLCDWRLSIAPARSALRRFLHSMPRGSMCGRSGDAAGEASFPFSACGRVACMCVAIASSRHGCPASAISLVPARSSLDRGMSCLMASVALADFGRSNGSLACPRSPRSVGRDLDLVLSRVSGELSREHVAGLARDTHLWFLFEARRTYG